MNSLKPILIALQFDDCINNGNLQGLVELMTEDHMFIDNDGKVTQGRETLRESWRSFFEAYNDYRTIITSATVQNGCVILIGNSICSNKKLEGPNLWTAKFRDGQICEWRVTWLDKR